MSNIKSLIDVFLPLHNPLQSSLFLKNRNQDLDWLFVRRRAFLCRECENVCKITWEKLILLHLCTASVCVRENQLSVLDCENECHVRMNIWSAYPYVHSCGWLIERKMGKHDWNLFYWVMRNLYWCCFVRWVLKFSLKIL